MASHVNFNYFFYYCLERLVLRVYELMGDDVLDRLGATDDPLALLSVARTLGNFATNRMSYLSSSHVRACGCL